MATRALFRIRKSSINAPSQASFLSRTFLTINNNNNNTNNNSQFNHAYLGEVVKSPNLHCLTLVGRLTERLFSSFSTSDRTRLSSAHFSSIGVLQRNLSLIPSSKSVITHPSSGFSYCTGKSQPLCYYSTSPMFRNPNTKFSKQRRNRGEMKGLSGNHICFGKYALRALEPAWISYKQIYAGQLAIKRNVRSGAKSYVRVFPHKPISLKPAETRMGRGKGAVAYWVANVRPGRILYELNGVPEQEARRAMSVVASKISVRTQFIKSLR